MQVTLSHSHIEKTHANVSGKYYPIYVTRTSYRLAIPDPITNMHPHDRLAKVAWNLLYDTYPWKFPQSSNPESPRFLGIDYFFGMQKRFNRYDKNDWRIVRSD